MTNQPSDDNDNVFSLWRLNFQVAGFNDYEEWISFHILLVQFNIRSLYKIKMFKTKPWSVHSVFKPENLQYMETLNNKC